MKSYQSNFFQATDTLAYSTIRSKVDGTSEYIGRIKAGGPTNESSIDNGQSHDNGYTAPVV